MVYGVAINLYFYFIQHSDQSLTCTIFVNNQINQIKRINFVCQTCFQEIRTDQKESLVGWFNKISSSSRVLRSLTTPIVDHAYLPFIMINRIKQPHQSLLMVFKVAYFGRFDFYDAHPLSKLMFFSITWFPAANYANLWPQICNGRVYSLIHAQVLKQIFPSAIIIKQKQVDQGMNTDSTAQNSSGSPVYGFLCEVTNVFYAFETLQEYKEFLFWLQDPSREEMDGCQADGMIDEDEMRLNCERATQKIMEVFDDPIFQQSDRMMQLEEIDF